MTQSLLALSDLHVTFSTRRGLVEAVRGVTLSLGEGEMLGLVGESGSGDVRAPALVDHGRFGRAAEGLDHRQDSLGPRLDRSHEGGAEGVEDGDLEVVDQAARQIGELGLRDELG